MSLCDHMEGFEKEANFSQMCSDLRGHNPETRFSTIHQAIAQVAPSYIDALHKRRACIRKLKFLGCTWCHETPPTDDEFFKLGQIYVSTSFNGATYTIEGYGDTPIGYTYFEWLKED